MTPRCHRCSRPAHGYLCEPCAGEAAELLQGRRRRRWSTADVVDLVAALAVCLALACLALALWAEALP